MNLGKEDNQNDMEDVEQQDVEENEEVEQRENVEQQNVDIVSN